MFRIIHPTEIVCVRFILLHLICYILCVYVAHARSLFQAAHELYNENGSIFDCADWGVECCNQPTNRPKTPHFCSFVTQKEVACVYRDAIQTERMLVSHKSTLVKVKFDYSNTTYDK